MWLVKDSIMAVLEGFHHRIARPVLGITVRKGDGGEWEWDSVDVALGTMGI